MAKRKRRVFTEEFKAQTVRLVHDSGKSVGVLAREPDLGETVLRKWVRQAEVDAGRGRAGALTTEERDEVTRLRREVRTLRMGARDPKKLSGTPGRTACVNRNSVSDVCYRSREEWPFA